LLLHAPPATSAVSTLSLHDALPISDRRGLERGEIGTGVGFGEALAPVFLAGQNLGQVAFLLRVVALGDDHRAGQEQAEDVARRRDRKSTRLNSSHVKISYAVFCLKK